MSYIAHDFYCICCGKKGIPLSRPASIQRSKHHRKKLWCPYCKREYNMIECRTYEEVQEFKEKFENGDYLDELAECNIVMGYVK